MVRFFPQHGIEECLPCGLLTSPLGFDRDKHRFDFGQLLSWSLDIGTGTLVSTGSPGNSMDQNHNGTAGEPVTGSIGDTYAAPAPVNGALAPPFDRTTRPLIVMETRLL